MEFMFTPVRGKLRKPCPAFSTPQNAKEVPLNLRLTPILGEAKTQFTPVHRRILKKQGLAFPTHVNVKELRKSFNQPLTPIRSESDKRDCNRCERLKRLEKDLCSDIPVEGSPRLEIVRRRVASNYCKAIRRRKEIIRFQHNDVVLTRKRILLKEKSRVLAKRYVELRTKMAAILDSSIDAKCFVFEKLESDEG